MENNTEKSAEKLELHYERQYRKERSEKQKEQSLPGTLVFVYGVKGPDALVNEYIKSKEGKCNPKAIKDDKGTVRFYSIRDLGHVCPAMVTSEGEWVADTTKLDRLKSLTDQFGYEIAKDMLNGKI